MSKPQGFSGAQGIRNTQYMVNTQDIGDIGETKDLGYKHIHVTNRTWVIHQILVKLKTWV